MAARRLHLPWLLAVLLALSSTSSLPDLNPRDGLRPWQASAAPAQGQSTGNSSQDTTHQNDLLPEDLLPIGQWQETQVPLGPLRAAVDAGVFPSHGDARGSLSGSSWRRLYRRLSRAEGVQVLGIGSSIMGAHGGCTEAPTEDIANHCQRCCTPFPMDPFPSPEGLAAMHGAGWARIALDWVNATWPSPDHRLRNLGRGGGSPSIFSSCPTRWIGMAEAADLVLLEFGVVSWGPAALQELEALIREIMSLDSPPAVLMANFVSWCRDHGVRNLCEVGRAEDALLPEGKVDISPLRDAVAHHTALMGLASHYNIPTVDMLDASWGRYFPSISLEQLRGTSSVHARQALLVDPPEQLKLGPNLETGDGTHPSALGNERVFGPAVVLGIYTAMHRALRVSLGVGGLRHHVPPSLPLPLLEGHDRGLPVASACFDFTRSLNLSAVPLENLGDVYLVWPPVSASEGFQYVDWVHTKDGVPRFKPGFQAEEKGAFLELSLAETVAKLRDSAEGQDHHLMDGGVGRFKCVLGYLSSHEGMGQVGLACHGGCSCGSSTVDGHRQTLESISASHSVQLLADLSQSHGADDGSRCILRLTVLDQSTSGGHRFKALSITLQMMASA